MLVVDDQFRKIFIDAERKNELDGLILEWQEEKQSLEQALAQQAQEVQQEQEDVDALERFSVKGMLLGLTGKKEAALKKERLEARDAKVQYEITAEELTAVSQRLEAALTEQQKLGDCHTRFWEMFPPIYTYYRNNGGYDVQLVTDLELQMIAAAKHNKELREALDTGREGRRSIDIVLKTLKEVRASEDDAPAPGSAAVRSQIAAAQQEVMRLRDCLCTFKEELLDLHLPDGMKFDLHEILQLKDDCLTGRSSGTNITDAHNRLAILLHPSVEQLEAILPYLEKTLACSDVRLHQAQLSLAQYVLADMEEK